MEIKSKYSVGDVVYWATTTTEQKKHDCPDCCGSRKWKAVSPAGNEYTFSCPRCASTYHGRDNMSLAYTVATAHVKRLTIGSVSFNSAFHEGGSAFSYMCVETGVGGGSVYAEQDLFENEQDANHASEMRAKLATTNTPWIAESYNKSFELCDYQLDNAQVQHAKNEISRARMSLCGLGDLFEEINEASGKEEILEAIEDYKSYRWERAKQSVSA